MSAQKSDFEQGRKTNMTHRKLGEFGTCGGSKWRESFTAELVKRGFPAENIYNPVVPNWTQSDQDVEDVFKADPKNLLLFYITDPGQEGLNVSVYSILEARDALQDKPESTVVVFDNSGLTGHALKAVQKCEKDLRKRFPNAPIFSNASEAIDWLTMEYVGVLAAERFDLEEQVSTLRRRGIKD